MIEFIAGETGFNSNMVRLKGGGHSIAGQTLFKFQFQYGAIKSNEPFADELEDLEFQFQYGAIKRQSET